MHIANALLNSLIVSGLVLLVAVILGIRAEKKPDTPRATSRPRRRSTGLKALKGQPRMRAAAGGR